MFDLLRNRANLGLRFLLLVVSTVALVSIWACNKKAQPSAAQASPKTFASPDDAGKAFSKPPNRRIRIQFWPSLAPDQGDHLHRGYRRRQSFA